MEKLKEIENTIFCPDELIYGVRLGEKRGNSTVTDIYIKSPSMEEEEMYFRIYGSLEREALSKVFKELSEILK